MSKPNKSSEGEKSSLQKVIVDALSSYPYLLQRDHRLPFQLFNYLVGSMSLTDKNNSTLFECQEQDSPAIQKVSISNLASKILKLDPHAELDELYKLFENKKEISSEELYYLLEQQGLLSLDIAGSLDSIFDENGYMSETKLRKLMRDMDFPELRPKELAIIFQSFDMDLDRKVSKQDFLGMVSMVLKSNPPT